MDELKVCSACGHERAEHFIIGGCLFVDWSATELCECKLWFDDLERERMQQRAQALGKSLSAEEQQAAVDLILQHASDWPEYMHIDAVRTVLARRRRVLNMLPE